MALKRKIGEYLPIKKFSHWFIKSTITETKVKQIMLVWQVQRMEENRIPKKYYI